MKKEENDKYITGIIGTEQGDIVFFAVNFTFTFMATTLSNVEILLKTDDAGYIWGKTHDEKVIAIYSRQNITIRNKMVLHTWNYIVFKNRHTSKQSFQSFKSIRFENGAIKTIYPCNGLVYDTEMSQGNDLVYHIKKDCKKYKLAQDGQSINWIFSSMVQQSMSLGEGDALSNTTSLLDVIFDEEQQLSVFYDYYGYVCDLCSFLTFRKNITFEKVYLCHECIVDSKGTSVFQPYAECYIKKPEKVSERKLVDIIHMQYIDEAVFKNIFNSVIEKKKEHKKGEKYKGLPLSIAPEDDSDVYKMDIGRIKNICSDLEMELDLEGVKLPVNEDLKILIKWIKKVVNHHKKDKHSLTEREYGYIYGNMSYWKQPLIERVWIAWQQHKDEMTPFLEKYDISITEENIQAFVASRNNATHNGFAGISDEVCSTAFALMGLIYCCALTRLGMQSDIIKRIMEKALLG